MTPREPDPPELEAELAALADDALPPDRRAAVQARVDASPELTAMVAEQRRVRAALRAVDTPAPARLRSAIAAARATDRQSLRERLGRVSLLPRLAVPIGAATCVALALVLVLGGPSGPTVVQAAVLGSLPAEGPAPPARRGEPKLLAAEVDGVSFPEWTAKFGWRAVGSRTDEIGGRQTRTVFYENDRGRRLGYTIVSGEALDAPGRARSAIREGTELDSLQRAGRTIVTWERDGRTCVLSGEDVPLRTMLDLAGWRGQGAIDF